MPDGRPESSVAMTLQDSCEEPECNFWSTRLQDTALHDAINTIFFEVELTDDLELTTVLEQKVEAVAKCLTDEDIAEAWNSGGISAALLAGVWAQHARTMEDAKRTAAPATIEPADDRKQEAERLAVCA